MAPKSRIRPKKEPTPEPSSSSDSSSDSSEDAENETNPQDHDDDGKESSSESEAESGETQYELKPTSDPSKKRAVESNASNQGNPKRSKTDEKKPPGTPITRLWTEADEIALLNGMVEFKNQKGSEPRSVSEIADFTKGRLSMEFSVGQIRTKIRRMKARFSNALKKRTDGKDPVFSDPHEVMLYEISKKIWGDELGNVEGGNVEANESSENEEEDGPKEADAAAAEDGDFWGKYPHLCASFDDLKADFSGFARHLGGVSLVKERLELIGDAKAKELNEKWKELLKEEVEIHYKKIGLMIEQVKLALD